ncbi:MAG: DUF669 domain-containing protein [Clostridia bacterium]|nr:DUF669 domain-containing protein [Clostridia bacterium]
MDYSKFDKAVDVEGLKNDVKEAAENGGEYRDVPYGSYEVSVDKMELTESKKGDPMVSIWFKILSGEYKNSRLFFNQVITQGFQIHNVNELLRSMDTGLDIEFESYSQYGQLLMDVHEAIDGNLEFGIKYEDNKGYAKYTITDIFEVKF